TEARAARRCDMRLSASRRPGAAPRPSQLVSQDIFQRLEVEGLVGDDPLQLAVLVLELLEPLRVRNLHAAVLPLPGIQGLSAHAEPAAQLAHVRACLRLLDRSDLLLLREPALAHDSSAFGAPESDYKWIRFRGSAHAVPEQCDFTSSAHGSEGAAVRAVVVGVQVPVADHGPASHLAFVLEHKVDIAPTVIEPALEVEADVVAANIGTCRRVAADPVDDRTAIVAHDPVDVDPCLVAALVADADLPVDAVERRTVDAAVDAVPPFEAAVAETEPITAGRCQQGQQQHCGQGERGTNRLHAASPQVWRSDLFTVRQTTSSRVPRDRSHAESRL